MSYVEPFDYDGQTNTVEVNETNKHDGEIVRKNFSADKEVPIKEVATILEVKPNYAWKLMNSGVLTKTSEKTVNGSRNIFVSEKSILDYMDSIEKKFENGIVPKVYKDHTPSFISNVSTSIVDNKEDNKEDTTKNTVEMKEKIDYNDPNTIVTVSGKYLGYKPVSQPVNTNTARLFKVRIGEEIRIKLDMDNIDDDTIGEILTKHMSKYIQNMDEDTFNSFIKKAYAIRLRRGL